MRLGIATKVFVAFAGVTLIFSMVLMFGVYRTQMHHGQLRALNHRIVPLSLQLSDIQNDLKSFHVVLNETDLAVLRRTLQLTRLLNTLPDAMDEQLESAAQTADLSDLDDLPAVEVEAFAELRSSLMELSERGGDFSRQTVEFADLVLADDDPSRLDARQIDAMQEELRDEARQLDMLLTSVRAELKSATDEALVRADETERTSVYGLGVLSVVALLISLLLMWVVLVTLRPLTDLTQAAKRIGEGDYRPLSIPEKRLAGDDEITLLAREFNAMAQRLAQRDARLHEQHAALLKSERLATIGRMTSLITHELRNPLSSINLNAEMLMDALHERGIDPTDPEVMPLLETIIEEVDHLRDITEEYLVYARLPSPKLERENLGDIVQGLLDFHVWEFNKDDIDVTLKVVDGPVEILADANQLRQALLNILKNAIDATDRGGKVEVLVERRGERGAVIVRDTGAGMDGETQQRLFEPFFTTKSSGTGLGLPMTQQIVEQHHGELTVESTPDEGSTFVFLLPLADGTPPVRAVGQDAGTAEGASTA